MVPPWAVGLWRRRQLETGDGSCDRSSIALWLQTDTLFGDVRINQQHSGGETRQPAKRLGFAGRLRVKGQICEWIRDLDTAPSNGNPDAGAVFVSGSRLIECGVHENYLEHWEQVAISTTPLLALRAVGGDAPEAILTVCGEDFVLAERTRHGSGGNEAPLSSACHVSYGKVKELQGAWIVRHSTNAEAEGLTAIPRSMWRPIARGLLDEVGSGSRKGRTWRIMSSSLAVEKLCVFLADPAGT